MASALALAAVLLFLSVILTSISICTIYWRVFFNVEHLHSDSEQHKDFWRFLNDGLPFNSIGAYEDYNVAVLVTGLVCTGALLLAGFFIVEMIRIFQCTPGHRDMYILLGELVAAVLALICLVSGSALYATMFFMDESRSLRDLNRRLMSNQMHQFISNKRWQIRPGYSYWFQIIACVFVSTIILIVSCQVYKLRRHMNCEGDHCVYSQPDTCDEHNQQMESCCGDTCEQEGCEEGESGAFCQITGKDDTHLSGGMPITSSKK